MKKLIVAISILLSGLLLASNIVKAKYNCFNGYDLGIYHQALLELGEFKVFNPFITVRGEYIFNDHFDPVTYFAAIFVKAFGSSVTATLVFEFIMYLSFAAVLLKLRKPNSARELILILSTVLFSKGILTALTYPVHASFWSAPIWALLVFFYWSENWRALLAVCSVLIFFKESYPFAICTLGVGVFLFEKKRSTGFGLTLIGGIGLILAFWVRPLIWGPIFGHGQSFVHELKTAPVHFLIKTIITQDWSGLLKTFWPLLLLMGFSFNFTSQTEKKKWWVLTICLLPLFAIQFLAQNFAFQYAFTFYVAALSLAYFQGLFQRFERSSPGYFIILLAFIISGFSHYQKGFESVFMSKSARCEISSEKELATVELEKAVSGLDISRPTAASGGVIPRILRPGFNLLHIRSHAKKLDNYEYLLLERRGTGDAFPLSPDEVEQIISRCKATESKVLIDNSYYYLAQGRPFEGSCIENNSNIEEKK